MLTSNKTTTSLLSLNFVSLVISSIFFYSSMYIVLNYLPDFVLSYGGSQADIGLATGALVFSSLLVRLFAGWIIDKWGRKWVIISGCTIFTFAPLLYGFVNSVNGLIAARMMLGIGLSLFTTAGLTVVTDITEKSRWGEATGFFLSAQLVAISLAPGLGSLIAGSKNMLALIPYAASFGLFSLILSVSIKTARIHVKHQSHIKELNKHRIVATSTASMAVGLGYATVITFLPIIAKQNGMNSASLFYLIYALIALIVRAPAGRLSDRIGRRLLIFPTVILSSVALLLVSKANTPLEMIIAAVLYGVGFGSAYPIIGAMAVDHTSNDARGIAVGFYQGGFDSGLLLGSVVGGKIGQQFGVSAIFMSVAVFILAGLLLFYFLSIPKFEN